MKTIVGFLTTVVILAGGAAIAIYAGWYNVAAVAGFHPPLAWALHTTMEHSVRRRAANIVPPPNLPELASQGFQDFDEMCVQCHGAPGKDRGEIGQGLAPEPPSLKEASQRWRPPEIFWIVKNGIHMTGMPAFGPTHDDDRIWKIVAFVSSLANVTAEQYKQLESTVSNAPAVHEEHVHEHEHQHEHQHEHSHGEPSHD